MTWEMGYVFGVVLVAFALFVSERVRVDLVALGIPVALLAAGIVTAEEAISGFSNEATVIVAGMLVLSLGLLKTGAVDALGRWARTAPLGSPRMRLTVLCLLVAGLSAFLNNTTVVVVFLPVFLGLAKELGQPPSLWLMPLSFSAILGGTVTLIGTSTNVIVYGLARDRGYDDFSMFSISPLGLVYLAVGMAYLLTVGWWLLPRRKGAADLTERFAAREFLSEVIVDEDSSVVGKSLAELDWPNRFGVTVLGVERDGTTSWGVDARRQIRAGDELHVRGDAARIFELASKEKLTTRAERETEADEASEVRLVEILVGPRSPVVGRTLRETRFQQRYGATVVGLQHEGRTVSGPLGGVRLEPGDLLLLHGPPEALEAIADERGFVPLGAIAQPGGPRPRALVAFAILLGVVAAAGLGLLPLLHAVLLGVAAALFTRCVRLDEVYAELDWMIVFLLAGVIPLGIAMDATGAAEWIGRGLASRLGPLGPVPVVAGFYVATIVLTGIMSNAATAVVLTPIAILTAEGMGMNPYALLVAIMFGASCDFVTPIGYQTNTLIYGPGGYRFTDYARVGGPLSLALILVAAFLIPILWPS